MFTRTTTGIIAAIFYVALLVFLNIAFDDEKKYPSMSKLVQRINTATIVVLLAVIIKFDLWC